MNCDKYLRAFLDFLVELLLLVVFIDDAFFFVAELLEGLQLSPLGIQPAEKTWKILSNQNV